MNAKRGGLFRLVLTALAVAACQDGTEIGPGQCITAKDCGAGESCVGGKCQKSGLQRCVEDADCADGQTCSLGLCEAPMTALCETNADCAEGQTCDPLRFVCLGGPPNSTCSGDADCGAPERVCIGSECVPGCATEGTALLCGRGESCEPSSGRCRSAENPGGCRLDTECPAGSICQGMVCTAGCTTAGAAPCPMGTECAASGRCVSTDGSCTNDADCGAPAQVCEGGRCEDGCARSSCPADSVCDQARGRCVALEGPCGSDAECTAPESVCEGGQCVPGCGNMGGIACRAGQTCDLNSGRCASGGAVCESNSDCPADNPVCDQLSGDCGPSCTSSGCPSTATCDRTSGQCVSGDCVADGSEEDDSPTAARAIAALIQGQTTCPSDDDYFAIEAEANQPLTFGARFRNAEGNLDLQLLDPRGTVVARAETTTDDETLSHVTTDAGRYLLRVWLREDRGTRAGNTYSLSFETGCGADRFEENDTRQSAHALMAGTHSGLTLCENDADYYQVQLARGDRITGAIRFSHASGDIDLRVLDPSGTEVLLADSTDDDETFNHTAARDGLYAIEVSLFQATKNRYDLEFAVQPATTGGGTMMCTDDALEPNETIAAARALPSGTAALVACLANPDYYRVPMAVGEAFEFYAFFTASAGNINLELFDPSQNSVARASSAADNEQLSYVATEAGNHAIKIEYGSGTPSGNNYAVSWWISGCQNNDSYEPNNDYASATVLPAQAGGTSFGDLMGMCATESDVFAIDLASGQVLSAEIEFSNAEGDLDLYLYQGQNTADPVAQSPQYNSDVESFSYTAPAAGRYHLVVVQDGDTGSLTGNRYVLSVSF